jgi:hypothetical protein
MEFRIKKQNTKIKFNTYLTTGVVIASLLTLVLILANMMDFVFVSNDDIFLRAIISGSLTGEPEAHAIYILYPLAWILALLYRMIPGVDWYGIFIVGSHLACWAIVLLRSISIADTKWKQIRNFLIAYFLLIFLDLQWLIFEQYTALASVIACTALVCIITVNNKNEFKAYALPIVLLTISFMLRNGAALMCIVFVAIYMLFNILMYYFDRSDNNALRELLKVYLKIALTLGIVFALIFGIHKMMYQSEEWKYYDEYNHYRTEVYDYYMYPSYENNIEFYKSLEIQREEMYLIHSMNLDLDLDITSETMNAIYDKSKEIKDYNLQFSNIPRRLVFDYLDSFDVANRELIVVYLLYGSVLVLSILKQRNSYLIAVIMTFLARSGMRSYLIFMERLPDRVDSPLALIEIVTLFGILLSMIQVETWEDKNEKSIKSGYIIGSLCLCIFALLLLADVYKENYDRYLAIKAEETWSEDLVTYTDENRNHIYLLDVYSVAPMKAPVFSERKFSSNAIILGGWLQESPILEAQYEMNSIDSNNELLLLTKNVYFIQKSSLPINWVEDYYRSNGIDVKIDLVEQIFKDGQSIYNIYDVNYLD